MTTRRFGLNTYGSASGRPSDDAYKYSDEDRHTIDGLLHALEDHSHSQIIRDPDPVDAALTALGTGGNLVGGQTLYYAYTYVNKYGLESAPSPTVSVTTPAQLSRPTPPGVEVADTGGTLATGRYRYGITALDLDGNESILSGDIGVTATTGTTQITISHQALPPGSPVAAFRVWRKSPSAPLAWTKLGIMNVGNSYVDDGSLPDDPCPCDPAKAPPTTTSNSSTSKVTVSIPVSASTVINGSDSILSWRLYRTNIDGTWSGASLVGEMETVDGSGDIVVELEDVGSQLLPGLPPEETQFLAFNSLDIPVFTTVGRPVLSASDMGRIAYDSDLKTVIAWDGTQWNEISSSSGATKIPSIGGTGDVPVVYATWSEAQATSVTEDTFIFVKPDVV